MHVVTDLQAVVLKVVLDKRINVRPIYLPPRSAFSVVAIPLLLDQLPSPVLFIGDFYVHILLWVGDILDKVK